ncbi:MAG: putative DNA binding domain-containing protein [Candidatus Accumulibacter sp.]|nr:RNA-binding domain-containing protein [Accumulibacter sp.]MBN8498473.1 putative DNA binding domain-containing protein [Accumulibacter sp.]MBO3714165.1 putative DNA binding domain-containing protein [Accumulibacter sp.]
MINQLVTRLADLVRQGESATLEFKKSTAEKDRACRTLCAFANGQGGQLVFGVTSAGKVVGQQVTDRTLEELAQEFQGFEPPLMLSIERIDLDNGLQALVVHTLRKGNPSFTFRGVTYERVLNTTRVMPREHSQRPIIESAHATTRWETEPAAGWTADQLDQNEILPTIEEAIRRGRCEDPGSRDPQAILRGLGLLLPHGQLSRAALALFCRDDVPLAEYPQFKLRLARFKGATRDEFLDNRQYTGNAFNLMRRAERFLIDWLPVASKIVPGQMARIDTPALPPEATREALANAFVHRDYASAAGSVAVALYDDRLENHLRRRTSLRPDTGNAIPASRINPLEPMDCQRFLPPGSDRNLGWRHAKDSQPDARRRPAAAYYRRKRRLRHHDFRHAGQTNVGENVGESIGRIAQGREADDFRLGHPVRRNHAHHRTNTEKTARREPPVSHRSGQRRPLEGGRLAS